MGTVSNGDYVLPNRTYADNVFSWAAPFKHGRNDVTVDDGQGHSDSAVLYFEDSPPAPILGSRRGEEPAGARLAAPSAPAGACHDLPALAACATTDRKRVLS